MAKYRITSIPQYRGGGMKKKKQPVVKSGWDSPVEGFTPDSPLAAFMPNQSMINQPTEYTIDPSQQDIPYNQRTGLEQLATQPEFGDVGYGYKRDPFTGELKTVPAGTTTYERDYFGRLIDNVKANPDAPVDYEGNKLNCGPGKRPWKGVCLTEEEYAQVQAEQEENLSYWDEQEKNKIAKQNEEFFKKAQLDYENEIDTYIKTATTRGNKHKKGSLEPFRTYKKEQWEEKQSDGTTLQDWYNDKDLNVAGKSAFYLDKKDLGDGNYEVRLYPRPAIQGMMVQYGVQPGEFEKFHGLDAKQLKKEYAPFLKDVHNYYLAQGQDFIDKWTKQGFSADEVKRKLVKDKNYGIPSGIESNFKDIAEDFDFINNATKYYVDNNGVMYTKDRTGNVYKYTNDPNNEDFKVVDYSTTDDKKSPFSDSNNKQATFTWQPVDKSNIKVGSEGGLYIDGKETALFDYDYKGRNKNKNENTIISNYKKYINDQTKKIAQTNNFNIAQSSYQSTNDRLFDHVYGNRWMTDLEEISLGDQLTQGGLNNQYVTEYNNAVKKINALTKGKDVSKNPDYYRKEKAKIVEQFFNKVKGTGTKVGDEKVNFGALSGYSEGFGGRDVSAYKDKDKLKQQRDLTTNEEALSHLQYAFANNINPTEKNIINDRYRGEKEGWKEQYGNNFYAFAGSPEGKNFLENYKRQPTYGQALFDEAYKIKETNLLTDKYNKDLQITKQRMAKMNEDMPWYGKAIDQGMALIQHPYDTVMDWKSGKLQTPLLGLIGDQPYQADLDWLDATYGTGASQIYQENLQSMQNDPVSQFTSLINPFYFAGLTGRGLNRRLVHDDPQANWGDIGMNALFAFLPASKKLQGIMGAKLLAPVAKYAPAALKTGKYLPRIGNAVNNLVTPNTALNTYFLNHAFVPHTDPETGKTVQGFGTQAYSNIYDAIGRDENGELKLDWDKISPNLINAYMATHIGKGALGNANQFIGNSLGRPSLINTSKLTQPVTDRLQNFKSDIINSPRPYIHPTTGRIHYIKTLNDLPAMNNNRFGINYKQTGGQILPKAARGLPVKEKKSIEVKTPKEKSIEVNNITVPKINTYSPAKDLVVQTIKNNLKDYNTRRQVAQSLKDLGYVGKDFTGMDALKAAKSESSMNKLMQLAIDNDRTGYRQVTGDIIPIGTNLGGYGNRKYDMTKQHFGRPMSQIDHMRLSGVDFSDPLSIAAYQASTVPFEQYGYRAGIDNVHQGDAVYLSSLPGPNKYGKYQFKITMPTDFSKGNWLDWYVRDIMGKKPYILKEPYIMENGIPMTRSTPKPGEVLFDLGASQGKSKNLFGSNNILTGSGLQTRRWIGSYGTKLGEVDPNFQFTDLFNMNTEQYKQMEDFKESLIKGYNTGWRGQYKRGGELPKARYGFPVKLNQPRPKPKPRELNFKDMVANANWFPDISGKKLPAFKPSSEFSDAYWKTWNSLPQEGQHKKIRPNLDQATKDLAKNIPFDSFSPIRFGNEYLPKGEEWYYVNPEDYYPLINWKELGLKDANESLNKSFEKLPAYGSDTFKDVGDFDFKPWSDGWEVRNQMMNAFDGPQWAASGKDFFSRLEFNDMLMKQLEYDMARMKFDDILWNTGKLDDYVQSVKNTEQGLPPFDPELFSHLFPDVGMPNWRSKFTKPEQEEYLKNYVGGYNSSVANKGLLSESALKNINFGTEKLPILNNFKSSTLKPFKGRDAWNQITSEPGYKNKKGGISMKLSKSEIDKYVKGGYIVEEE